VPLANEARHVPLDEAFLAGADLGSGIGNVSLFLVLGVAPIAHAVLPGEAGGDVVVIARGAVALPGRPFRPVVLRGPRTGRCKLGKEGTEEHDEAAHGGDLLRRRSRPGPLTTWACWHRFRLTRRMSQAYAHDAAVQPIADVRMVIVHADVVPSTSKRGDSQLQMSGVPATRQETTGLAPEKIHSAPLTSMGVPQA
jgi:hypothetical protein